MATDTETEKATKTAKLRAELKDNVASFWAVSGSGDNIVQVGDKVALDFDVIRNNGGVVLYSLLFEGAKQGLRPAYKVSDEERPSTIADLISSWLAGEWVESDGRGGEIRRLIEAMVAVRADAGRPSSDAYVAKLQESLKDKATRAETAAIPAVAAKLRELAGANANTQARAQALLEDE